MACEGKKEKVLVPWFPLCGGGGVGGGGERRKRRRRRSFSSERTDFMILPGFIQYHQHPVRRNASDKKTQTSPLRERERETEGERGRGDRETKKKKKRRSQCLSFVVLLLFFSVQRRWEQDLQKLGCVNSHRGHTNTLRHSERVSGAPVPAGCIHAGGVSTGSARRASSEQPHSFIGRRVSLNAPSSTSFLQVSPQVSSVHLDDVGCLTGVARATAETFLFLGGGAVHMKYGWWVVEGVSAAFCSICMQYRTLRSFLMVRCAQRALDDVV